ncbi:MAG: SDR family NAD(P)-dependent oxidoreductase [Spirochaetales bacterium]
MEGKIAIVTGALGGIGKAITKGLLEDGFRVVLVDLNQKALEEFASTLKRGKVLPLSCDITDPDAVEKTVEQVKKTWGVVDVLVNNAGILSNHKAMQTTPEEWRKVMAVNLDGAFYFSRAVMEDMKEKRWGRIVNISSLAAKSGGITAGTAYTVSKGALISLTFSLAAELAPYGVTVNGIAPTYVKTAMVTDFLSEEQQRALQEKIPVKRFCEPEEIAHTVRFLVHPLAGFITGEIIDQNGGLHFD